MQKRYIWIVAAFLLVAGGAVLFLYNSKSKALARYESARIAYEEGDSKQVISLLETVSFSKLPAEKAVSARLLLAQSYSGLDQTPQAKREWHELLKQEELDPVVRDKARMELALINQQTQPAKSLETFKELAETSQNRTAVAVSIFEIGKALEKEGNLLEAKAKYQRLLEEFSDIPVVASAVERIGSLSIRLLFSKRETEFSRIHRVKPGESLASIAKKYNMPLELLMESNQLKSPTIHPNDRLKVCTADFSILVNKSQNTLTLKANEELFKIYRVGTGKEGSTPIGSFKLTSKLVEPTWYHPDGGVIPFGDSENLLGTRWLGIDSPGYGIHGTWDPGSVGKQSSAGCIRLKNKEVEELFKIVTIGTPVTIVE